MSKLPDNLSGSLIGLVIRSLMMTNQIELKIERVTNGIQPTSESGAVNV
jgi:hypothetical protein